MSKNIEVVQSYFEAAAKGDFDTVSRLFSDDIVWHQPGKGIQSGTYKGKSELFSHLGNFAQWSNGTFSIDHIEYLSENGNLVAVSIHFKAEKDTKSISMQGIDLLKVEGELIKEVWLFSEHIDNKDSFWNFASNK